MGRMFKALEKAERERNIGTLQEPVFDQEKKEEPVLNQQQTNSNLISLIEPGSLASEQFRKLRVNLRNIRLPEAPRTLLITSTKDNEGKTLVAANLAITLSQELNARALLVEADIRNPIIAKWFDLPDLKGLSDYLTEEIDVASVIYRSPVDKLSFIPGGSIKENPVELVGSKKMENLIQELKSRYCDRYIIIDSSPLLATTEPNVMTKWVDAVLLVIKAGETQREEIQQAIGHLKREKIIGVVLNQLQFRIPALHSKYFGSVGYYHRYGSDKAGHRDRKGWRKYFSGKKSLGQA